MGSEGSNQDDEGLQHLLVLALLLREFVHANHEGRDRGVIAEGLDIARNFLNQLMNALHVLSSSLAIVESVLIEVPELLQEAVTAVDAGHVPRLRLLNGTEEHLVEAQRVGTVALADVVGVHHVVLRLRHLLDGLHDDVLAIGIGDELGLLEVGHPLTYLLNVEFLAFDGADVGVDGVGLLTVVGVAVLLGLVVVLHLEQVEADVAVGAAQSEHEAGPSLYHALVDELAERLVLAGVARVVEELVPEA